MIFMKTNQTFNNNFEPSYIYFQPGDLVVLNKEELNSPIMMIREKVSRQFKTNTDEFNNVFIGMKCIWFDKHNVLQEAIFSTKDLKFYDK